jgi:predicted alpha/beta-hydrolase family hydrolase
MALVEIETPHGWARVHVQKVPNPRGALVMGHGAGGGVEAPDLAAARAAALESGLVVALVEQPYRVAGRKSPPRAPVLDTAWTTVVEHLTGTSLRGLPLVLGGRSMGARVACRTAASLGAAAVLCLAFPLEPPSRAGKPRQNRQDELDAVTVPVLVVQGESDPFGMPRAGRNRLVVKLAGNHGLKADLPGVSAAVADWLARLSL